MNITAQVTGAEEASQRFESATDRVRAAVRETVESLGLQLLRVVKQLYLSGAALGVRTGRLRRSVNEETTVDGDAVTSTTGTNVAYGRFWELGFNGIEDVKEHVRRTTTGGVSAVRAHTRRVSQLPRPFLSPALDDMRPAIIAQLARAARKAI